MWSWLILLLMAVGPLPAQRLRVRHAAFSDNGRFGELERLAPGTKVILRPEMRGGYCFSSQKLGLRIQAGSAGEDFAAKVELEGSQGCNAILTAVLPNALPLGTARLTLSVDDESYGPTEVEVVPSRFGILGTFRHSSGNDVRLTRPARAGSTILVRGSGLGRQSAAGLEAIFGSQQGVVVLAEATPAPGLEEVQVQLPAILEAEGCYLPFSVSTKGESGNGVLIPVTQTATECAHPLGLTAAQMVALDSGRSIALTELRLESRSDGESGSLRTTLRGAAEIASRFTPRVAGCSLVPSYSPQENRRLLDHGGEGVLRGPDGRMREVGAFELGPGGRFIAEGIWRLEIPGGRDVGPVVSEFPIWPAPEFNGPPIAAGGGVIRVRWNRSVYSGAEVMTVTLRSPFIPMHVVCMTSAREGNVDLSGVGEWLAVSEGTSPVEVTIEMAVTRVPDYPVWFSLPLANGGAGTGVVDTAMQAATPFVVRGEP